MTVSNKLAKVIESAQSWCQTAIVVGAVWHLSDLIASRSLIDLTFPLLWAAFEIVGSFEFVRQMRPANRLAVPN